MIPSFPPKITGPSSKGTFQARISTFSANDHVIVLYRTIYTLCYIKIMTQLYGGNDAIEAARPPESKSRGCRIFHLIRSIASISSVMITKAMKSRSRLK